VSRPAPAGPRRPSSQAARARRAPGPCRRPSSGRARR
jgi:hypothetical protein